MESQVKAPAVEVEAGAEGADLERLEAEAEESPETCGCVSVRIRSGISRGMFRYGDFATRRPCASLLLSLAFVAACAPGFALLGFSGEETNLYVRGSLTLAAHERQISLFPFTPEITASFQLFAAKPGKDLMAPRALLEVGRALDGVLLRVRTAAGDSFSDACERSWRGFCEVDSIFHYFRELAPGLGLNVSTPAGMGEVEGLASHLGAFCASQPAQCRTVLARQYGFLLGSDKNRQRLAPDPNGLDIDSFQVIMYLDPARLDAGGKQSYGTFQAAVLDYTHSPSYASDADNLQTENFYVTSFSKAVLEFESARPSTNEGHLLGVAFALTLVFVCCSIFAPPHLHSRVLLGLSSMAVVTLSLACAMGLSGYVGVPFTSMTALAIFTLFGVSVDDIIVMVHAYDRLPGARSLENVGRDMQKALHHSGPSISLTTATTLVAFLSSAFCPIPNITYFCITAAFGILSVFVLQLTLFVPLFYLDERRRLAGRRDCFQSACRGGLPEGGPSGGAAKAWRALALPSVEGGFGVVDWVARALSGSHVAQAAIILLFAAACGLGVWGATQASSDADLTSYFIDDSFLKEYYAIRNRQYTARMPFYLVVEHKDEGLFDDARASDIGTLFRDLTALDCSFEPHENWFKDFEAYLNASHPSDLASERARLRGNASAFGAKVLGFLDSDTFLLPTGRQVIPWRHKRNVMLEGGVVRSSRLVFMYESNFESQARYIDNLHRSLDLIFIDGHEGKLENPRVPGTFGTSKIHPAAQRDEQVLWIIYGNLAQACGAVAITVMLMLNPLVGIYVGLLVMALDVIIVALLTLYGNKLDFVAFLVLSMTIGLVVDYSTHTAHAYMHHAGSPDEKLYHAVSKMGASVLAGGGSTVLGILALAGSGSEAFRSFFRVLGTAIFVGTSVGITVGPVLLRALHGAGRLLVGSRRGPEEVTPK